MSAETEVSVEATGETVGEAKWAALRDLERKRPGLDKAAVRFQVVSEGERGLLGVGYSPARVVASIAESAAAASAPVRARDSHPDESEHAAAVRELVERVADEIGATCSVAIDENAEELSVVCSGGDLGLLIGRHGQTIDAIQYLANAVLRHGEDGPRTRVTIDAAGYRERRATALHALAQRSAEHASATGRQVELEPMTAVERKVVHEYLKEDPEVETASEGTEPNRFVIILPRRSVD